MVTLWSDLFAVDPLLPLDNEETLSCPKGHHRCMTDLTAAAVVSEARALLATAATTGPGAG